MNYRISFVLDLGLLLALICCLSTKETNVGTFSNRREYIWMGMIVFFKSLRTYGYDNNGWVNFVKQIVNVMTIPSTTMMRKLQYIAMQIGIVRTKMLPTLRFEITCK